MEKWLKSGVNISGDFKNVHKQLVGFLGEEKTNFESTNGNKASSLKFTMDPWNAWGALHNPPMKPKFHFHEFVECDISDLDNSRSS